MSAERSLSTRELAELRDRVSRVQLGIAGGYAVDDEARDRPLNAQQRGWLEEIDNHPAFVRHALEDELRYRGASLDADRYNDCLAYLGLVLCVLPKRYDPTKGLSFRTYAYRTLRRRYTDFLRKTRGDSRYGNAGREVAFADPTELHEAIGVADPESFDALIEHFDHDRLSQRARGTLKSIARVMAEEGISAAEAADRIGKRRREANSDLARLRSELAAT